MTHSITRNSHKGLWYLKTGEGPTYRSNYVVDYEALTKCHSYEYHTPFCMAGSASSIDNIPDTSSAVKSRIFHLIRVVGHYHTPVQRIEMRPP
jgi:hypothetical protein